MYKVTGLQPKRRRLKPNWENFARFNLSVLGGLVLALVNRGRR